MGEIKSRPDLPWFKFFMSTLEIIAEAATPEETHEAFSAAWLYYSEGKKTSFEGIRKVIYKSMVDCIDSAVVRIDAQRAGGRKGGLISAALRQGYLEDTSNIGQGYLEDTSTEQNRAEQNRAEKTILEYSAEPAQALNDLKEICEKGHINLNAADLEAILAELAGQGWTFGGEPIRNYSKVLRWYERHPEGIRKPWQRGFQGQRQYNYNDLEKQLLSRQEGEANED